MYPSRLFARSSLLGVITAAALLFGQLSGVAHLLIVDHQRCLEHGELVHAPAPARDDARRQHASMIGVEAGETHAHDHCLCVSSRRDTALHADVAAGAAIAPAAVHDSSARPAPPAATRRWLLAPKNSPPRAA